MSRLGAAFGSAAGALVGGAAAAFGSEFIPTGGHPREEHAMGWAAVGAVVGGAIGAALGAGSSEEKVVVKTIGTGGCDECIGPTPLHDPRFP